METFKDTNGRDWTVSVNCETIERARTETQIDILEAGLAADQEDPRESVEFRLTADPILFCRVLKCFLVQKVGDDDNAYITGLTGDALAAARKALWADLVNFTPSPEKELRATILEKMTAWLEAGWSKALEMTMDPRIDTLLAKELTKLDGKYSALLDRLESGSDD